VTSPAEKDESDLVARLRVRDEDLAEALFVQYAEQLARLAERQLSAKVTRRIDGDDVVQSVFRTFFVRVERGEFQIDSSDQLWKLLVQITLRKAAEQARKHTAAMRDGRRDADGSAIMSALVSRPPELAEALLLNEEIDRAIGNLPVNQRPHYRRLLELKLAGFTNDEIAEHLAVVRRTVERMLVRLQGSLAAKDPQGGRSSSGTETSG
jgi:RNA polymerase sigma-70 factor (ECF subfamily)